MLGLGYIDWRPRGAVSLYAKIIVAIRRNAQFILGFSVGGIIATFIFHFLWIGEPLGRTLLRSVIYVVVIFLGVVFLDLVRGDTTRRTRNRDSDS